MGYSENSENPKNRQKIKVFILNSFVADHGTKTIYKHILNRLWLKKWGEMSYRDLKFGHFGRFSPFQVLMTLRIYIARSGQLGAAQKLIHTSKIYHLRKLLILEPHLAYH